MSKPLEYNHTDFHNLFYYDETSPSCLRYKVANNTTGCNKRFCGDVAGNLWKSQYYLVKIGSKNYTVHRIIWTLFHGSVGREQTVDHIDRNKQNNKITNLRCVDIATNSRNCNKNKSNTSGKCGVSFRDGKYQYFVAYLTVNGKRTSKSFSVDKHGFYEAYQKACEARDVMVKQANDNGAGFSEQHGR